ncbi:E3 ubiquitin-protein ligase SDIR1 [Phytophthora citrophthora]|uniref:RING-type E3 ubiquitin transferase n=1 Tax=Phytophthora citrophthora TaxID=4793 RepID=A0AAD9G4T1_9STRA|nr:E3 ubiquitin-protein ligase SDIR1 [Phytophthora citrophthora]
MDLQLNVTVRYTSRHSEAIGDVLRHFESPAWVRLVLRQVLPQLKQISPTDPKKLTKMVRDAENNRADVDQDMACSICMAAACTGAVTQLKLPCGHQFHSTCAQSWLRRRSTCPLCRFQLPKAYTGTFAIAAVQSTLRLLSEHDGLSPSELQVRPVGDQMLQVAVTISMARISTESLDSARRRKPCQVSVAMLHANGSSALMPPIRNTKRQREELMSTAPGYMRGVFKRVHGAAYI